MPKVGPMVGWRINQDNERVRANTLSIGARLRDIPRRFGFRRRPFGVRLGRRPIAAGALTLHNLDRFRPGGIHDNVGVPGDAVVINLNLAACAEIGIPFLDASNDEASGFNAGARAVAHLSHPASVLGNILGVVSACPNAAHAFASVRNSQPSAVVVFAAILLGGLLRGQLIRTRERAVI